MRASTLARSEQPQSRILEIARTAVRSAALAPSDSAAIDAAGAALARIAAIARAENQRIAPIPSADTNPQSPARAAAAFQRIHFLIALVDSATQLGAQDRISASALLKDAMDICRLNGESLQTKAAMEVQHGR